MYNEKFPTHTIVTSKSKTGQPYITQVVVQSLDVRILWQYLFVPPFQNINSKLFTSLQEKLIRAKLLGLSNKNF